MLHDSAGVEKLDVLTIVAEVLGEELGKQDHANTCWGHEKEVPRDVQSLIKQAARLVDQLLETELSEIRTDAIDDALHDRVHGFTAIRGKRNSSIVLRLYLPSAGGVIV